MKQIIPIIFCLISLLCQSQEKIVSGVVSDQSGPLPYVNVIVKSSPTRAAQADIDGKFSIKAGKGEVLEFRSAGFKDQDIPIADETPLTVMMQEDRRIVEIVPEPYHNPTHIPTKPVAVADVKRKSKECRVTGIITDENGEVLPFVSVQVKSTKEIFQTDFDGKFSVIVKKREKLIINCVCFETMILKILKSEHHNLTMKNNCYTL